MDSHLLVYTPLQYFGVLNSFEKAITALNSAFWVSLALLFPAFLFRKLVISDSLFKENRRRAVRCQADNIKMFLFLQADFLYFGVQKNMLFIHNKSGDLTAFSDINFSSNNIVLYFSAE